MHTRAEDRLRPESDPAASVVIYMRPGCHLCEEARKRLAELDPSGVLTVTELDIETDDELHRRFLELIPVIELDGKQIAQLVEFRTETFAETIRTRIDV